MVRGSAIAFALLLAAVASGQSTPPPSGALPPPITAYAGRYLDSGQTRDFQFPNRTLRAQLVKVAPERNLILMKLSGSLFAVYRLDLFAGRSAGTLSTGAHGEKFLPPDVFSVDPQNPSSGWNAPLIDGQEFLFDFDYDDRGYFYLAYSPWGFGIVDSAGALQSQVLPASSGVFAQRILAVRDGANVRAVVSDAQSVTKVYDVTNPSSPVFLRSLPFAIGSYAKLASGGVAVVTVTGQLRVYATGGDLAADNPPGQTFTPQPGYFYVLVATDGTRLFATQFTNSPFPGSTIVSVLTPASGSFSETRYAPRSGFFPRDLKYGAGYLVASGFTIPSSPRTVLVYDTDFSAPSDLSGYFGSAYPAFPFQIQSAVTYASGGQTYLIAALTGVGDVFVLAAATPVPALSTLVLTALGIVFAAIALSRLR